MEAARAPSAAAMYQRLGWSFIPTNPTSKLPLLPWKEYQGRHPRPDEVDRWSAEWPWAGIAVITGRVSGLLVLDADGAAGLDEVDRLGVPKTPMALTPGGGLHAYFKSPGLVKNAAKLGTSKKIDVRGEGGYVLAPHTKRQDGKKYEWLEGPNTPLAEPPTWFLELLTRPEEPLRAPLSCRRAEPIDDADLPNGLSDRIKDLIVNGHDLDAFSSRSECDMVVFSALVSAGLDDEEILDVFDRHPIGEKLRTKSDGSPVYRSQAMHYVRRSLSFIRSKTSSAIVKIKHADLTTYNEDHQRIHLCLIDEHGEQIRTGVTAPRNDGEANRWKHLFAAAGLKSDLPLERACQLLVGRSIRVALGERTNPVMGFYKA